VAPAQELAQNASRFATILAQILEQLPNAELCAEEELGRRNGQTLRMERIMARGSTTVFNQTNVFVNTLLS
jgi:hypothetical protein